MIKEKAVIKIDLHKELMIMKENYTKKPLNNMRLRRPGWVSCADPISQIYVDKKRLLKKGTVCYAHIVQANEKLFDSFPPFDYPAVIIYSMNQAVSEDPSILWQLSNKLFSYKNKLEESIPENWRGVAGAITDEYSRDSFVFTTDYKGESVTIHFIPVMIFRKLLPKRKLCGGLIPVLAMAEKETVMILPKRYWAEQFKDMWIQGAI